MDTDMTMTYLSCQPKKSLFFLDLLIFYFFKLKRQIYPCHISVYVAHLRLTRPLTNSQPNEIDFLQKFESWRGSFTKFKS